MTRRKIFQKKSEKFGTFGIIAAFWDNCSSQALDMVVEMCYNIGTAEIEPQMRSKKLIVKIMILKTALASMARRIERISDTRFC